MSSLLAALCRDSRRALLAVARCGGRSAAACLLLLPAFALAQGQARGAAFVPSLSSEVTYVDIRRFDTGPSRSETTVELQPGFRFTGRAGRMQGSVAYGLGLVHRTRNDPNFEARNQLAAALNGALVEDLAFLDVSASIAKQSVSAFGQQSVTGQAIDNPNQQEVGTLNITPSLRGRLAGVAAVDLRVNTTASNTRKSLEGDSLSTGASLSLSSVDAGALLGWSLSASTITTDYRTRADAKNDRATLALELRPDVDLGLSLRAGRETAEVTQVAGEAVQQNNWGASLRWQPSPRTLASFTTDRRFFGRSHAVNLSYRLARSSFRFGSVRDITLAASADSLAKPASLYDLFFEQFASQEPDPVQRQQLVLNFLSGLGLDPAATVTGGSINRGPTVQQRSDIGWIYGGQRLTVSGQAFASRSTQLGLEGAAATEAGPRQRGYTGNVAYRLTPTATLNLQGSRLMTKATNNQAGTDLKSLGLNLTERLGRHTTAGLSARYSVFNSVTTPYRETAVSATLGLRY
ncbi:TIGR03016 family PEP-CTERM system-associated outer membrane protein [Rubrivivax rivuli]|uniref:TIGR03016 family PEP-CTERM system-associated outer membrane protein n=1 Tax=Rubrivivax rivuli TaxID=1862385 RepID=A0A437RSS4_9BURK|nr:TIGR03016 family PEP-CTERM system-associated outer membrane protein [Rubrivivax rivuli]RVU49813.1 TIGR03016 family PEP-CTERM system-associated outer membrane protein [Rubrivivax rivuli]